MRLVKKKKKLKKKMILMQHINKIEKTIMENINEKNCETQINNILDE